MEKLNSKYGRLFLRVSLSLLALYFVFTRIDSRELLRIVATTHLGWLSLGLFLYNLSKILSSFRLQYYFRDNGVSLSMKNNLVLYYIGMFYNLFLPGGIGGDTYKVWLLRQNESASTKNLVQSVLFDRLSGMVLLCALSFVLGWVAFPNLPYRHALLAGAATSLPVFYLINYTMAKRFLASFPMTSLLSCGVQGLQVLCAWAILAGLGVNEHTLVYITVFLISSVVAVLPISVGGIGIRELVFVAAAGIWPISKDVSVAFSFLFFLLTALSSFPGGMISLPSLKK